MLALSFAWTCMHLYGNKEDRYRMLFNNHMVRAMSVPIVGAQRARTSHAKYHLPAALESMEKTYGFVGLTENLQDCTFGLARALGLAPPPSRLRSPEHQRVCKAQEFS